MYNPNMCASIDSSALKFLLNEETTKIYCRGHCFEHLACASSKLKSQFCHYNKKTAEP